MKVAILMLLAMAFAAPAYAADGAPAKVLVFDMEIVDYSGEGANPDHAGRLQRMTGILRDGLKATGRYEVTAVGDSAVAAEVPAPIYACNGCELDLGRKAGADIVVTSVIHKISTLILNIRIILRDVGSGETIAQEIVDIRGDNERSWRHGVEWILRHRLTQHPP